MNEVQLIRGQLSVERQHAASVARACASSLAAAATQGEERVASLADFRQASVDYLVWILTRFEEREQMFHDLLRARLRADDPQRLGAESCLASAGSSREALAKLEAALGAGPVEGAARWADFLQFFTRAGSERRDQLDRLFAQIAKVTDWRTVSAIDADSIFDERGRYARVLAALPAGVELPAASVHT